MMKKVTVIDPTGNHEENLTQWAKTLGKNKLRRKLFNTVYGPSKKPMSKKQIMQVSGIKDSQQAQNELNHLASHGLIVAQENDGAVKDKSQILYCKDPNVRKIRKKIVVLADNPARRNRVPTKRKPQGSTVVNRSGKATLTERARRKKHLNVLYLTADANKKNSLRVDAEIALVQDEIQRSKFRNKISVHYKPAANLKSLLAGLNDCAPQIVHFSGHGWHGGLAMDNGSVSAPQSQGLTFDLLAKALAATDTPPSVVVLNSCHSSGSKKALLSTVKILIIMKDSISDLAAANFAANFYGAIASGQSIKAAFSQAVVFVESITVGEGKTPELVVADGVTPSKTILV